MPVHTAFPPRVFDPRLPITGSTLQGGSTSPRREDARWGRRHARASRRESRPCRRTATPRIEDWMIRLVMPEMQPIVDAGRVNPSDESRAAARHQVEEGVLRVTRPRVDHRDRRLHRLRERLVPWRRRLRPPPPLGAPIGPATSRSPPWRRRRRPELHEWIEQAGRAPGWR